MLNKINIKKQKQNKEEIFQIKKYQKNKKQKQNLVETVDLKLKDKLIETVERNHIQLLWQTQASKHIPNDDSYI